MACCLQCLFLGLSSELTVVQNQTRDTTWLGRTEAEVLDRRLKLIQCLGKGSKMFPLHGKGGLTGDTGAFGGGIWLPVRGTNVSHWSRTEGGETTTESSIYLYRAGKIVPLSSFKIPWQRRKPLKRTVQYLSAFAQAAVNSLKMNLKWSFRAKPECSRHQLPFPRAHLQLPFPRAHSVFGMWGPSALWWEQLH